MKTGWLISLLLLLVGRLASAQEMSDDEIARRMLFIEHSLHREAEQARAWEIGWSIVYVGGGAYGAYQIGTAHNHADLANGSVGAVKSVFGALSVAFLPMNTAKGAHPLDGIAETTHEERMHKLALAESLLRKNAVESNARYQALPHLVNAALSLAGGGIIWAFGDRNKGLESAGIGLAVGEVSLWTRPWKARKDESSYRREFGGFASPAPAGSSEKAPAIKVGASSLQMTF